MKCFKKVAALLFCVALALSVMAVGAFADDEAQLFSGANGVTVVSNSDFTVMLTKSTAQSDILDRDNVQGYEINYDQKVSFDIIMAYSESGAFRGNGSTGSTTSDKTIDGFQFEFKPENNYGATLYDAVIYKNTSDNNPTHITHPTDQELAYFGDNQTAYQDTYAYSSLGTKESDITLPSSETLSFSYNAATSTETVAGGTKIGMITLAFTGATQAVNIYPQIENLLIHVRDVETLQQPVAATDNSYTSTNATGYSEISGTVNGGKNPSTGDKVPTPNVNSFHGCTIRAFIPVIVNPVYNVTLEKFAPNENSGIIAKVTEGQNTTVTLKYDFMSGSFLTNNNYTDGSGHDTILTNPSIFGYTFKGWMVTVDTKESTTWAAYTGQKSDSTDYSPKWDMNTSYPATTTEMSIKNTPQNQWEGDEWNTSGKVSFTLTTNEDMTMTGRHSNTADGVNFITVNEATEISTDEPVVGKTAFPAGLVGDITLTPVYTRDVYTATFNSGDNNASFGENDISPYVAARVGGATDTNGSTAYQYTRQYTIEDLWGREETEEDSVAEHVLDFFTLNDANVSKTTANDKPSVDPAGPQGLTRKAYKFVGWDVALTEGSTAPNSAYIWNRAADLSATASYNSKQILKEATAKHYGDVTFTAQWEEDIYYAEIGYQYAGTANSLILVAVPKGANYNADYTYTYKVSGANQRMFIIPEGDATSGTEVGQRAAYLSYAKTLTNALTYDEKITDAKTASNDGYVMFAYIDTASTDSPNKISNAGKVEIVEAEGEYGAEITDAANGVVDTKCANYALKYDGDVDGSKAINVGDFGNVDSLLNADTAAVFQITGNTGWYGVRARLEADVYSNDANDTLEGDALKKFASIADVKTIYNLMGYKQNI